MLIVLSPLHIFTHLILTTTLGSSFYLFHLYFTDEETNVQADGVACPRLQQLVSEGSLLDDHPAQSVIQLYSGETISNLELGLGLKAIPC